MNDYNFFSGYERKKSLDFNIKSPYFIAAIVVIICLLLILGTIGRNLILSYQINKINDEINTIKTSNEYIVADKLESSINAMTEYDKIAEDALKKFTASKVLGTKLLNEISSVIPQNSKIASFSMDNTLILLEINVPSRKVAAESILYLKDANLFISVHMTTLSENSTQTGYIMNLECILKGGEVN